MKKFVVKSEQHGYFNPNSNSGSLWYNEADFVPTIGKAYWYARRENAEEKAIALFLGNSRIKTTVVPIEVTVTEETPSEVDVLLERTLNDYQELVAKVDDLTDAEVEAMPAPEWQQYRHAKRFVQDYGTQIRDL